MQLNLPLIPAFETATNTLLIGAGGRGEIVRAFTPVRGRIEIRGGFL